MKGASLVPAIGDLVDGHSLGATRAAEALGAILDGGCAPEQVAGFLVALSAKGPTAEELVGLLAEMEGRAVPLTLDESILARAVDVVGTGGDGAGSVNVSTMAALVVAGAGIPVVKHGGRKASGTVGAADVLEALGVTLAPGPEVVARCVTETGFGFCFAPAFHPSLAAVAPVRAALGIRTVFNYLGPMANPAGVRHLLLGVSNPVMLEVMAMVIGQRGVRHALVVRGDDGLDEVTVSGRTRVVELRATDRHDLSIEESWIDPVVHGIAVHPLEALRGGDAAANAAITRSLLDGAHGPIHDVVVLNAAAAIVAADAAPSLDAGIAMATESLARGAARQVLDRVIDLAAAG